MTSSSRHEPIPSGPVQCVPTRIQPRASSMSLDWISKTEASLASDWSAHRASAGPAKVRRTSAVTSAVVVSTGSPKAALEEASVAPFPLSRSSGVPYEEGAMPMDLQVGEGAYRALRTAWRTSRLPSNRRLPPAAAKEELDENAIYEAVGETTSEMLNPPVPLPYMIDILIDMWEESGLYDEAAKRENQAARGGGRTTK